MKKDEKILVFDRAEKDTKIKDAFVAFWGATKTVLGKQKDNEMLRDMNVEKGLFTGLRYLLYLGFVLPFKVIWWLMTPKWEWISFVQRHLVSPIFEVDAISGEDSPSNILGELYEKYVQFIKNNQSTGMDDTESLQPEIGRLERLMIFAKVRVLITLGVFIEVAFELQESFEAMGEFVASIFTLITGVIDIGDIAEATKQDLFNSLVSMGAVYYIGMMIVTAWFAYLAIFALRFIIESIKSVMYADSKMMTEFVDDTLHYSVTKTVELYGEKIALDAYELLLENVVLNKERYVKDEYIYKRIPQYSSYKKEELKEELSESKEEDK